MSFNDEVERKTNGVEVRRVRSAGADSAAGDSAGNLEAMELALNEAIGHFRASVHAWSSAEYGRARTAQAARLRQSGWRLASGWALGVALAVGGISAGVYQEHRKAEQARIAAVRQAEQQRQAAVDQARAEEELLARVDSDVAREVPMAMEPLAQLMDDGETK